MLKSDYDDKKKKPDMEEVWNHGEDRQRDSPKEQRSSGGGGKDLFRSNPASIGSLTG